MSENAIKCKHCRELITPCEYGDKSSFISLSCDYNGWIHTDSNRHTCNNENFSPSAEPEVK
jgi:hypothetical protein